MNMHGGMSPLDELYDRFVRGFARHEGRSVAVPTWWKFRCATLVIDRDEWVMQPDESARRALVADRLAFAERRLKADMDVSA